MPLTTGGSEMPTEEQVHVLAESFQMLADPTRMKILWALLQGETSVACLAELVGSSPAAVSQHLAKLRAHRHGDRTRERAARAATVGCPASHTGGLLSPRLP